MEALKKTKNNEETPEERCDNSRDIESVVRACSTGITVDTE